MSLQDFARALTSGTVPTRAVVVTFDDRYANNLYNALPSLERYQIPATIFICTGYVGKAGEYW